MNSKSKGKKRQRESPSQKRDAIKKLKASDEDYETPVVISYPAGTKKHSQLAGGKSKLSSRSKPQPLLQVPSPSFTGKTPKKFLTPQDGSAYESVLKDHYQGFVHVPTSSLNANFHMKSKAVLERLRDANYYQYDVVMAGGKHSSRTFVKRTLVGDPGITYKYLGLRLFAHAWSGPGVLPVMKAVGDMNKAMIKMTQQYENHGRCNYNLTLINYMEPLSHPRIGFKEEADYGMGKVSVSWHADSSLELNSSIGVFHCLPTQKRTKWDWRIALRRSPDSGVDAKHVLPLSVPTRDGDAYFLLGTFNETHQHCVLAGSEATRISSTHRVAVTKEDTYEYILRRAKGGSKRFHLELQKDTADIDQRVVVHCQKILTQVELDWIAQYWLQGAEHDKMHVWWQKPMKTLESYWSVLEDLTYRLCEKCRQPNTTVRRSVIEGLLEELRNRHEQREKWDERRADKIYQRRITPAFRPVAKPQFGPNGLGKNLESAIDALSQVLSNGVVESKTSSATKRKKGTQHDSKRSHDSVALTMKASNVESKAISKHESKNRSGVGGSDVAAQKGQNGKKKNKKKKKRKMNRDIQDD